MANFSTWNRNVPSGTSLQRDFPSLHRSEKSILEETLDEEHYFESGSAASAGIHRLGSARVFVGTRSQVSASNAHIGRLMYASDTSTLHMLGASSHETVGWPKSTLDATYLQASGSSTQDFVVDDFTVYGVARNFPESVVTVNESVYTIDLSATNVHRLVVQSATTLVLSGGTANAFYTIELEQDGSANTVLFSSVKWPSSVTPSFSVNDNRVDIATIYYNGSNYFGALVGTAYSL